MKKFKYLFKKLFDLDFASILSVAKKVNEKTGKSTLYVFFDIILCTIKYEYTYSDYYNFEFFHLNNKERCTYLNNKMNDKIIQKYNDVDFRYNFDNREAFNDKFKKFLKRKYISIENKMLEDFVKFVSNKKKIVVKPIDKDHEEDVEVISIDRKTDLEKLFNRLVRSEKFIIEEYINQSKTMNLLFNGSVNILKVITFYKDKEVHVLSSILKIAKHEGAKNEEEFIYAFVNDKGKVITFGVDSLGKVFRKHPVSKTNIKGFMVSKYKDVLNLVSRVGKVVPEVKYVCWDIAITSKGPILIKGDNSPDLYQIRPSISGKKKGDALKYRKLMDI